MDGSPSTGFEVSRRKAHFVDMKETAMPRIDRTMLKGLDLARFVSAERTIGNEVLEVTVLKDEDIFEGFVTSMYDAIASTWEMYHPGGTFPVTHEQFTRYSYTAVRARVARVRNERFHVRCDDSWTVPAPLASVLAGLGVVELEAPVVQIRPKWNSELDDKLLAREEWELISRRLRAVEKDENAKFVFAHAIEGGRAGDEALLCLIPVRDAETGRIAQLEGGFRMDPDPVAAIAYLILGLEPYNTEGLTLPPHVLRSSPWTFRVRGVLSMIERFAEASVA
jgi:hypothetical protein